MVFWDLPSDEWHFDDSSDGTTHPTEYATQKDQDLNHDNSNSSKSQKQKESKNNKNLWSRIKDGCSFVDDNSRLSSWLFASNPHGTQMANLICAIDPWCDLYVAKVTEGRYGISPERVTKAIQWAIDQNVDIISMNFAILDKTDALQKACTKAIDSGIVLICSTHDEGANISTAYPASFRDTIRIMACDEFGAPTRNMKDG
ncbi:peptidase S8/S53 domain-containing protein [Trichoderma evansii]